jgi:hypothetical protein
MEQLTKYNKDKNKDNYKTIDLREGRDYHISSSSSSMESALGGLEYITLVVYVSVWAGFMEYDTLLWGSIKGLLISGFFLSLVGVRGRNWVTDFYLIGICLGFLTVSSLLFYAPLVGLVIWFIVRLRKL